MRRPPKVAEKTPTDLDSALAAMSAEALREVVHEVLLELDGRAHARVVGSLIARAARAGSGWTPAAVSDEQVAARQRRQPLLGGALRHDEGTPRLPA